MQTEVLKLTGMTCGGCASKVSRALQAVAGVSGVAVSWSDASATVQYDGQRTSPTALKAAVRLAGYGVQGADSGPPAAERDKTLCCG